MRNREKRPARAATAGWLCLLLALFLIAVWPDATVLVAALWCAAFLLSIAAMAQGRIFPGLVLLLVTVAVTPLAWLWLSDSGGAAYAVPHVTFADQPPGEGQQADELLIDRYLDRFEFGDLTCGIVPAPPEQAYRLARHADFNRVPVIRSLFWLRTLPERLFGSADASQAGGSGSLTVDDIVAPGSGFMVLAEQPSQELVVGAVGKFWKLTPEFKALDPSEFKDFDEPGYAKLAWNIRVRPYGAGRTLVSIETRVLAMDEASRRRFGRYWRIIGPMSRLIRRQGLALIAADAGRVI